MSPPRVHRLQPALRGAFLLLLALLPCLAQAQASEPQDEGVGVLMAVRGVGEVWQESTLARELGRSSRFGGTGYLSYRAWRFLAIDIEAGYHRMAGTEHTALTGKEGSDGTTFELVPIALSASARHQIGDVELFGALGAAFTVFTHEDSTQTVSGTKIGPAFHAGARLDTGLVQPSIRRDTGNRLQSVDLEFVIGRRQHQPFGIGTGFDLSAWRVGVGLLARM